MDVFNPDEARKGTDIVIQVAWKMGLELEVWAPISSCWCKRKYPDGPPLSRAFYRIKPKTSSFTGETE